VWKIGQQTQMVSVGLRFEDKLDGAVDRPFSNSGQLMCHEVFIHVEDSYGSTWVSDTPALKFL
jgi:hypothetical protein